MRLIQAGVGGFGQSWAQIVQAAPGVELVAAVDPVAASRERARAVLGLDEVFATLAEALTAVEADAVVVVSPPATHHAVASEALAAGKHVLVEKPLATTIDEALDLVDAAERAGRTLMVSQNYRYRAPARAVQAAVAAGEIGALAMVRVACLRETRTLFGAGNFRYSMRHPFLLDMSIHHADLVRAVTGADVVTVFARSWPVADSPYAHHPAMVAVMELSNGATVVYEGTWASHGPETSWNGDWSLEGERGRLVWTGAVGDHLIGDVTIERWGEPATIVAQPTLEAVDRAGALDAFRRSLERGTTPETSAADNVRSLAIVLGCVESIERGDAVDLRDLMSGGGASVRSIA